MATVTAEGGATSCCRSPPYTFGVPWPDLNDGLAYTDVVKPSNAAATLIEFYTTNHSHSAPPPGWIQRIRNEQITVDGEVATDPNIAISDLPLVSDGSDTCKCVIGSKLVYRRLPWEEPYAPHLLEVLYEDDHMIAINKPSGLQVLPGGLFQQRTVLTQLQWQAREKSLFTPFKNEQSSPAPVHRLGRGTSGILLCAKTKIAKTCLASYFADGTSAVKNNWKSEVERGTSKRILKLYQALVTGILDKDEVIITHPIGVIHYPGLASGLYVACSSGKPALSKVNILERDVQRNHSLVEVEIHSGRPHQIRIHLASIGHPLVGDPLYGIGGMPKCIETRALDGFAEDGGYHRPRNPIPGDCGYCLHAHRLVLCHPFTNEMIEITAPLPPTLRTRQESHGSLEMGDIDGPSAAACSASHDPPVQKE